MRKNTYLSVCMFQLKVNLDCDNQNEFLVENTDVLNQIQKAFEIVKNQKPDLVLFPEMTYFEKFEDEYKKMSLGRIIVAGSYYNSGINKTVVFDNGQKHEIDKAYASGAEPMARKIEYINPDEYLEKNLMKHQFFIKGKNIYIFNCMEYYHLAYYISRNPKYNKDLFGIFAICSNSNTHVFEEETLCTHNHNEHIYTFVLNCVSTYKAEKYGDGQSYIYGPVSIHEKEWLSKENIESKKNVSHILSLSPKEAQYIYGEFIFSENLSRFGRSDSYINNPRNIKIENL